MTAPLRYPGDVVVYDTKRGYRVVWPDDTAPQGRRSVTRQEITDASELAVAKSRELTDAPPVGDDLDLASIAAEWLKIGEGQMGWERSYAVGQRRNLEGWIIPRLGGPARNLTRADLADVAFIVRAGVKSEKYQQQILGTLRRLWQFAVQMRYVPGDREAWASMAVKGRRVNGQARDYVDPSQRPTTEAVLRLADSASLTPWLERAIILGAFSGLRWGEAMALEWSDLDVPGGAVRVLRQVKFVEGECLIKLPKGDKVRETILPADVAPRFEVFEPSNLVCPRYPGDYHTPQQFHRNWTRLRESTPGWNPDWTFHSLRHHFATWLLGKGVPIEDVGLLLGHASPDVTMRTYVGTTAGALDRARKLAVL